MEGILLSAAIKVFPMNSEALKIEWLRQNEKICICKGIPRKRFMAAIEKGASSVDEVNRMVGSGSGDCKGERCGPKIERLLAIYLEKSRSG